MKPRILSTARLSFPLASAIATPISPPSGPTHWLFQGPPAESKLLAVSNPQSHRNPFNVKPNRKTTKTQTNETTKTMKSMNHMNTPLVLAMLGSLALIGSAGPANAAVLIQPTGVVNTLGGNLGGRDISKTIDTSGMFSALVGGVSVATITTANLNDVFAEIAGVAPNTSYWISANIGSASFPTVVLTFDLGESFDGVDRVHLWNYSATNGVLRGLNNVNISFSSDNVTFSPTTTLNFTHPADNTRHGVQTRTFDAVSDVRYIRFTDITNHGDGSYLAFSEIRFGAIPEPSAALLGGLGLLALLRRRR